MKITEINSFLQGKVTKPLIDIKTKICTTIDNAKFYEEHTKDFSFIRHQHCPFPGHNDSTPSFRAREDGSYKCYGCNRSGSNIIYFWMHKFEVEYQVAIKQLYLRYVSKEITLSILANYNKTLFESREILQFLELTRGWHPEVIKYLNIGLFNDSTINYITIPMYDEYGYCISILFYNCMHIEKYPKFYYLSGADNSPKIFGMECLESSKKIYIFEGQPDWLLALSLGYPAITLGSANTWKDSFSKILEGYDIIICYDSDEAGKKGAAYLANNLALSANTIKNVVLPQKDFSDFLLQQSFKKEEFDKLVDSSEYFKLQEIVPPKIETVPESDVELSTLHKAGFAENYNKRLRLVGLVSGIEPAPLLIPKKMQMICQDTQTKTKCATCALAKNPHFTQIFDIDPFMKDVLKWVITGSKEHSKVYRESLNVNTRCKVDIKIEKMWNVEKVILNNPVRHGKFNDLPERRLGFYFGNGLIPNRHYTFDLYTTQHPIDNSAVHVVLHSEPLDTELENFQLSPQDKNTLKCFNPKIFNELDGKFEELYDILSKNVTRIWGRPLLHLAIDLPFFSPNEFIFAGEHIRRAGLDIMVFGDQRCGKGRIAEGLSNYYKFAEVLSGENTSFMNLVGGIESNDSFRGLKWGRIVANNGGVVIIDEASALEIETIARLSRIRSEGLAELDKFGIHAKALARCSIIWISNTRGDPLSKFNFGIEALRELAGQAEDIARFDYAVAVRTNEVDTEIINRSVEETNDIYGSNLHRTLILWCKTRRVDQVVFTEESINFAYQASKELGAEYSSDIPLVQTENIRIKLAKIAASIGGRVFSCDESGEILIVNAIHMSRAAKFLREIYENTPIAYRSYSKMIMLNSELDFDGIDKILEPIAKLGVLRDFLNSLLTIKDMTMFDIQEITGINLYDARQITGSLTREGALGKEGRFYRKSVRFIDYIKSRLERNLDARTHE